MHRSSDSWRSFPTQAYFRGFQSLRANIPCNVWRIDWRSCPHYTSSSMNRKCGCRWSRTYTITSMGRKARRGKKEVWNRTPWPTVVRIRVTDDLSNIHVSACNVENGACVLRRCSCLLATLAWWATRTVVYRSIQHRWKQRTMSPCTEMYSWQYVNDLVYRTLISGRHS